MDDYVKIEKIGEGLPFLL